MMDRLSAPATTAGATAAVMFCIKAFNAVTNGDLADDVASLSGRVDDREASISGYLTILHGGEL